MTWTCCVLAAVALTACASPARQAELRSPSHDYPPPPRTTADGEVIGADRKPVTDAIGNTRQPPKPQQTR